MNRGGRVGFGNHMLVTQHVRMGESVSGGLDNFYAGVVFLVAAETARDSAAVGGVPFLLVVLLLDFYPLGRRLFPGGSLWASPIGRSNA